MTPPQLHHRLGARRHLLVAYSGGLDSTVLLHQLVQLRHCYPDITLRAMHIHHGLSPHADEWAAHCTHQCQQWQVPLCVERVTLTSNGKGIESQARDARYAALARALLPGETLLTAQHQDDQCETLLLALKRGSGPAGLSAMPMSTPFAGGELLRPLLDVARINLEQWASMHQLVWVEDDSNTDVRFERNFLRQQILPQLTARWPHFTDAAARSAALCAEQESLLNELLADELALATTAQGSLRIAALNDKSEARRGALLRRWLSSLGAEMPSRDALTRIWHEVACARQDASPRLQLGHYEIRRWRGALWRIPCIPAFSSPPIVWHEHSQPLTLPGGLGQLCWQQGGAPVRFPLSHETVSVRFHAEGRLHIVGRERGRTLKKLWQELGIAPWLRGAVPLLFYDDCLIAAPGIFVTREGAAPIGQCGYLYWHKGLEL